MTTQIPKELCKKLFAFHSTLGKVLKDSKNPHFKSKYSSIDSVLDTLKPALEANKLFIMQPLVEGQSPEVVAIDTIVSDDEGNQFVTRSHMYPQQNTPQGRGSCETYLRRYALVSLFAMAQEDDDGNHASQRDRASQDLIVKIRADAARNGWGPKDLQAILDYLKRPTLESCSIDHLKAIQRRVERSKEFGGES